MPGVVEEDRAFRADRLQLVTKGELQTAVELGDHVSRERHRPGEGDVDPGLSRRHAEDALRLTGQEPGAADAVATNVHQSAAVQIGREPDIGWIRQGEAEGGADGTELPDRPAGDELLEPRSLGVVPVHERLRQQEPGSVGRVEHLLDVVGLPAQRLLAEDVLPGLERLDRPLDVERVGQGDVDRVELGVRE